MDKFFCDGSYEEDLREYTELVVQKYGVSSPAAQREIRCLADAGNTVAGKLFADQVFYLRLLRKYPYREAFSLYLKTADIRISGDGVWSCGGAAYPLSFWMLGYYLVNYRKSSSLLKCEEIEAIETMPEKERLLTAMELAVSCIKYVKAPGAVNLAGRILQEAAEDEALFEALKPFVIERLIGKEFSGFSVCGAAEKASDCAALSELFFEEAVKEGYVYACNNLAAREADRLLQGGGQDAAKTKESIERYINYLRLSADKYEPYAANRLGLFYITGEISSPAGRLVSREYVNFALAKEYFLKATVYPDVNSAWAFFNLLKYFQKDFDQDLEKINEYMDYIKELNPEVYDLTMEL
ncbi:MAG: hypothetical protein K5985_02890 [Lachnospiraceae bacterium]|nr:hypothetical protein [Lachnospiraceae bacterium]